MTDASNSDMDVALQMSILQTEVDKLTREKNALIEVIHECMSRNSLYLSSPHTFLFSQETIGSIMNRIVTDALPVIKININNIEKDECKYEW